jgi:hypothetical protein
MYFTKGMSQSDAKSLFRKLCIKLHPDKGGRQVDFVKMQNEYENFLKGSFSYTSKQAKDESNSIRDFVQANEFVKQFVDVTVELTGTWVWLCGNTFPYKDVIKENGFRFSKSKKRWYKAPYELKKKFKRGTDFNKIKTTYGYDSLKIKGATAIA